MKLEIYKDNGGKSHWCLAREDGTRPAVFAAAFGCARDERRAAADVRLHAGSVKAAEAS
jgi:hypothetical protein